MYAKLDMAPMLVQNAGLVNSRARDVARSIRACMPVAVAAAFPSTCLPTGLAHSSMPLTWIKADIGERSNYCLSSASYNFGDTVRSALRRQKPGAVPEREYGAG